MLKEVVYIKVQDKTLVHNKCVYLVFSSITSRHVSASTCDRLQVIL
jgi:hypothetical protein